MSNFFFVLIGIDHRERIKHWQKYLFSCNPIYRNQICRTRLCFYAPVAGPIWVRPDDVMVVIRARNALLQPIQFHRTKKRYCHNCIVLWLKLGLDLWRKLLQWILHTWPLWSETSCIRTGGEYSRKEVFIRNRPIVFPGCVCGNQLPSGQPWLPLSWRGGSWRQCRSSWSGRAPLCLVFKDRGVIDFDLFSMR